MYMYKLEKENAFNRDDLLFDIENETDEKIIAGLKEFDAKCIDTWGGEWEKGYLTLINEENWVQYAEDTFDDIFEVRKKDLQFYRYIDYEKFADDLKYDYSGNMLGTTMFFGQD